MCVSAKDPRSPTATPLVLHPPPPTPPPPVATRWYHAPELLLGPPYRRQGHQWRPAYGFAVDMWAIGCLVGELIDGDPVFPGDSDVDQLDRIQSLLGPVIPEHLEQWRSNPAHKKASLGRAASGRNTALHRRYMGKLGAAEMDFMLRCLDLDPSRRITAAEALSHPYFAGLEWRAPRPARNHG